MVDISLNSALKNLWVVVVVVVGHLIIVSLQVLLFENTIQIQNFEFFLWPYLNLTLSETCVGPMWDLYWTNVGLVWNWRPERTWSLTKILFQRWILLKYLWYNFCDVMIPHWWRSLVTYKPLHGHQISSRGFKTVKTENHEKALNVYWENRYKYLHWYQTQSSIVSLYPNTRYQRKLTSFPAFHWN